LGSETQKRCPHVENDAARRAAGWDAEGWVLCDVMRDYQSISIAVSANR